LCFNLTINSFRVKMIVISLFGLTNGTKSSDYLVVVLPIKAEH